MMQSRSLTPTALAWVRDDLDKLLDTVRRQAESIASNPNAGPAVFGGAIDNVERLGEILDTLTIDGAQQVARAMLTLLRSVAEGESRSPEEAASHLLDAIVVLPAYLDRVQAGHQDLPVLVLPLINRLREARGAEPLSEGTVFTPLLDVELPELEYVEKPGFDEPFEYLTGRLHRQTEKALTEWFRDDSQTELLSSIQGIFETMRHRVRRYDLKRLWWVASEVIGGLAEGHVENDSQLRGLLSRLSLLIKTMSDRGEDGIDLRASDSVTQALLFHVGRAKPGCAGIDLVRERFRLEELTPDEEAMLHAQGTLSGRDKEMFRSLSAAVEDELAMVKDALDLELRTGQVEPERRRQSLEALMRLGDTLSMLGLSGPGDALAELIPAFEASAEAGREARDATLVSVAEQLLLVESSLEEQIETLGGPVNGESQDSLIPLSAHEHRRIRCQLLDECVSSMHQSQDAVRKHIGGERNADPFEPLEQVAGALELAQDAAASKKTLVLEKILARALTPGREEEPMTEGEMEHLADAMAALELYLAASRDMQQDASRFLAVLDSRLGTLGGLPGEAGDEDTETKTDADAPTEAEAPPAAPEFEGDIAFRQDRPESDAAAEPSRDHVDIHAADLADETVEAEADAGVEDEADADAETDTDTAFEAADVPQEAPLPEPTAIDPAAAEAKDAEPLAATAEAAPDDQLPSAIDPELRDIFLEEYETVLETLQQNIPDWMANLENARPLTEIRRAFHTLKGSGRMVGAEEVGDFAWQVEDMLNGLLEGRVANFADISMMVRLAQASLPALRQRMLQQPTGLKRDVIRLIGKTAQGLGHGSDVDWDELGRRLPAYLATLLPGGFEPDSEVEAATTRDADASELQEKLAAKLRHIQTLLEAVSRDRATRATEEQLDAITGITRLLTDNPEGRDAEVSAALEGLLHKQAGSRDAFSPDALFTLVSAVGQLQHRLERLDGHGEAVDTDHQDDLIRQLEQLAAQFRAAEPDDTPTRLDFEPEPEPAPAPAEPDGTRERSAPTPFDPGRSVFAGRSEAETAEEPVIEFEPPAPTEPVEQPEPPRPAEPEPAQPVRVEADAPPPATPPQAPMAELDPEIVGIFLEEAGDVLERGDEALNLWREDVTNLKWVQNLQREIHTFKGGARMSGLTGLGDYSHEMETLLERIAARALPPTLSAVQVLEDAGDRLHGWVKQVKAGTAPDTSSALALLTQQIDDLDNVSSATPRQVQPETLRPEPEVTAIPEAPAEDAPETAEEAGAAQIKVSADLLDRLVNAASEVSIYRSRITQQVGNLRNNLGEVDKTLDRLREQFRKMEIETEVQIRSNYPDAAGDDSGDFDPLELDQFSTLQQLSRSLSESVSDLLNLQEMLEENARNADQLLQRQSRVSTELQEGLMKTRMVPFGTIATRLRRLVRSAAKETGKKASLQLRMVGSSDELDRNVLDHITAPLEHMMRNAIVHGIEGPADRKSAGKKPEGEITVTVESEATEFVIRIADDGAGIDLDAIRRQAVDRGLLDADSTPSREQLYEFMMDSGFSTSREVTKLAGRGVGMDVVSSDIKQIGGSLEIDSEAGSGTQFTIRIPFTLAIMQAIGLMAGENEYLLPLSSVVGVSRLMPDEYSKLVEGDDPRFRFAGQEYPVLDMDALLGEPTKPLGKDNVTLLILNAGEQKAAIRVPELLPHREVVIKPVGPQISSVPGILGGAIAGDGRVIVILDPGPLIRHALLHGVSPAPATESINGDSARKLVMVVDDSITMRKVTSRVLEDHDYEVLTARDGVDALEQLQERTPDLMLLDIEMPRMDGYELTERVRDDTRLRATPIMMITSRAGRKHRERAERLGANAYLTKPYQEVELIAEVRRLLAGEAD